MFVGDFRNGNIYHFKLNEDRTQLSLDGPLQDKIVDSPDELKTKLFGQGFGAITDLKLDQMDICMFFHCFKVGMIARWKY
jgi:aldose sugar dehydrogenase